MKHPDILEAIDAGNSRYWYARTAHDYSEYLDPRAELRAIRATIAL